MNVLLVTTDQQKATTIGAWLREPDPDAVATPSLFMAFDVLYHDRRELTARPLRHRRTRLEDVVAGSELVFSVRRLAPDGLGAWTQVVERGYKGYTAKDERSAYEGRTTRSWLPKTAGLDRREGRRMAFRMPVKPPPRLITSDELMAQFRKQGIEDVGQVKGGGSRAAEA